MKRDLTANDLPLLVLSLLASGSYHAYGIAREIEQRGEETLNLRPGLLHSTLRRMELDGLICGVWTLQKRGPARKLYSVTDAGREEQARLAKDWRQYVCIMDGIVKEAPSPLAPASGGTWILISDA